MTDLEKSYSKEQSLDNKNKGWARLKKIAASVGKLKLFQKKSGKIKDDSASSKKSDSSTKSSRSSSPVRIRSASPPSATRSLSPSPSIPIKRRYDSPTSPSLDKDFAASKRTQPTKSPIKNDGSKSYIFNGDYEDPKENEDDGTNESDDEYDTKRSSFELYDIIIESSFPHQYSLNRKEKSDGIHKEKSDGAKFNKHESIDYDEMYVV